MYRAVSGCYSSRGDDNMGESHVMQMVERLLTCTRWRSISTFWLGVYRHRGSGEAGKGSKGSE